MRILDLDLDFFVSPFPQGGFWSDELTHGRRSDSTYESWSEEELVGYLEGILGLSTESRAPGVRITHHDEAYAVWREGLVAGDLTAPFDVVHIDAHADLGLGQPDQKAFDILEREVLTRTQGERAFETPRGITPGNYLLYAAGAGWLRQLTYVLHPQRRRLDLPFGRHFDPRPPEVLEGEPFDTSLRLVSKHASGDRRLEDEVRVPLHITPFDRYQTSDPFDFIVIAQSPDFTPARADALLPIFDRYMLPVA